MKSKFNINEYSKEELEEIVKQILFDGEKLRHTNEPFITAKEVAEMTGWNVITIYRQAKRGDLPCLKVGNSVLFKRSDIKTYMHKQMEFMLNNYFKI